MPELPEVETVKSVLEKVVIGHTITGIDVLRDSAIHGDVRDFITELVGEKYESISRIGKFLIFHLTNEKVIVSHLRMEGKYYEVKEDEPNTKYSRVVIHLNNGNKICYDDSRSFGYMRFDYEYSYRKDKEIAKLGPEPWDADVDTIIKKTKKMSMPIKSALLSQELITGLGNIYVDETLYASMIHPLTPANKVTKEEWKIILEKASSILKAAILYGGSTIKSYHPGKGIDGNFQGLLEVYGHKDEPCKHCGTNLRFIKVGGRGTTYCPKCQQLRKSYIKVAIFGNIASGKSEVLNVFKENKIPTLSADEVVKELYQREDVAKLINTTFELPESKTVNKDLLREHLANNPKDIKKINSIVHPLVKKETEVFLRKYNKGLIAVEVPLLFESKMDKMFDVLIGVESPLELEEKYLMRRDGEKAKQLKNVATLTLYAKNKNKADYIIENDADLKSLKNKAQKIINKLKLLLD